MLLRHCSCPVPPAFGVREALQKALLYVIISPLHPVALPFCLTNGGQQGDRDTSNINSIRDALRFVNQNTVYVLPNSILSYRTQKKNSFFPGFLSPGACAIYRNFGSVPIPLRKKALPGQPGKAFIIFTQRVLRGPFQPFRSRLPLQSQQVLLPFLPRSTLRLPWQDPA